MPVMGQMIVPPSQLHAPLSPVNPHSHRHHTHTERNRRAMATAYIPGAPTSIVVDKGSHSTYVVQQQNGHSVIVFRAPDAIGKSSTPTPYGQYHIVAKELDPWWYPPPSIHHQPVPPWSVTHHNPLGVARIALDRFRINLHGTNAPGLIGSSVSHGCIRHSNADIMEIFHMVHIGDPVSIVAHYGAAPSAPRSAARIVRHGKRPAV
jgi:lipoprotein-anchoring transpeptidase ErfK/SrfK